MLLADNLKQALCEGGVTQEALETLISGPDNLDDPVDSRSILGSQSPTEIYKPESHALRAILNGSNNENIPSSSSSNSSPHSGTGRFQRSAANGNFRQPSFENDVTSFLSDEKEDMSFYCNSQTRQDRQQQANCTENRTILLKGLSEKTTHRDIVAAVRGGALVDVFLRPRERQASISFAEGKSAQEFLSYAKRQDLYILGKLIDISWSERQFYLPGHVAGKLANGASRNLVIRSVHPNLTEARIRGDLEHIHNLIVIDITFERGNAYISTNSVHNALFARTCMMSRLAYKGMKIEYYPDECAGPLPKVQYVPKKVAPAPPVRKAAPMTNRFQMLNMDGEDDSEEEDDLISGTSLGGNISWTNSSIAV
ncbi:hypothetical protein PABG_01958 [Paracoccidioides brasiliensis Pb03]|uniref:RRM domain-containing protein n=2 Tax=Paracoccidioides brasiliensis TaxID=121759 RepID=C1G0F1_PARBD|nr:uncharacterized protein PADG_00341 [Paracoccidioides brasiliensis Pb18]EEH19699.2 hypothetical protein PABG_01958 [Paracoccidioides brasiliensis Pb03]EEH44052.2 hypothetical protein PADG_00341 [Paracoccidioides brasiliensis Pb18]